MFKPAVVRPLLKKSLDTEILKNYRPLSNQSFLSKLTEKIALLQLSQHLQSNYLFCTPQSAYCSGHSTGTGLLKIVSDFGTVLNVNQIVVLSLPDVSAAFYTIDHSTPPYFWHFWHYSVLVLVLPL